MISNSNNKTALVTGASNGIGREIAIALAREGYSVAINFKTDAKAAQNVLMECDKHSKRNQIIRADVSNEKDVTKMCEQMKQEFIHLDVLVNNAGIFDAKDSPTNIEAFENIFRNNFLSAVIVTKNILPMMPEGKIINISSTHGRPGYGRPGAAAYSAFKAAMDNWTMNLAKELAPKIRVNSIAPGRVATHMWGDLDAKTEKKLGQAHLIKRMIQPKEIADAVLFIITNAAICGEILNIDGGMSLEPLNN